MQPGCLKEKCGGFELEFEIPNWNQVYDMLLNLAEKISLSRFKPDIIVGVSRGGWPPARVLSDLLSNSNLASVRAEFYRGIGETKGEPVLSQPVSAEVAKKRVLIVDEVADTGKSLNLVKKHLFEQGAKEVKIATIYYKKRSMVKPDYYEEETDRWIVFPWEVKETVRKIFKSCSADSSLSFKEETGKLVKGGIPDKHIERFLKEIYEEKSCCLRSRNLMSTS